MHNLYKRMRKPVGPGGFKCPCCNPYSSKRKRKPLEHRMIRRKLKQAVNYYAKRVML